MEIDQEIYFHNGVFESLIELHEQGNLAHAILFSGNDGCGHLELAIKLSAHIVSMKTHRQSPEKARSSHEKALKYIHPDVHFSFPFIGNTTSDDFLPQWRKALKEDPFMNITQWMMHLDAENKQANINAKECQNIISKLGLKSFESEYKVLLMWLPEYLGKEGNRLLKLIEEPPENTIFLLVTENLDRILNTILSRCQLIKIPNPSDELIKTRLVNQLDIPEPDADKICFLADGNYRLAKNMSSQQVMDYSDLLFDWLRTCYKLNPEEIVKWCDDFFRFKKEQQKYFITYALQFFRTFLLLDTIPEGDLRFDQKDLKVAEKLKRFINLENLEAIEELLNNSFMMIERNANAKILFMRNSIKIHELFRMVGQS